jgi:hypothetical protein
MRFFGNAQRTQVHQHRLKLPSRPWVSSPENAFSVSASFPALLAPGTAAASTQPDPAHLPT